MQRLTVQRYLTLSREALAFPDPRFGRPSLLVWPETAMPFNYETHPGFPEQIRELARKGHVSILFGAPGFRRNLDGSASAFNRAYLIGPDGTDVGWYEKEHLVPFGEYMPRYLDIPFLRPLLQGSAISPRVSVAIRCVFPRNRAALGRRLLPGNGLRTVRLFRGR